MTSYVPDDRWRDVLIAVGAALLASSAILLTILLTVIASTR